MKNLFIEFLFPINKRVLELESISVDNLPLSESPLALFNYKDALTKELLWEVKYRGNRNIASRFAEALLHEIKKESGENPLLIPIPISDKRRLERGFNQTEIICEEIIKIDKLEYLPKVLTKSHHTESQTNTTSRKERLENLMNSMKASQVSGRNVVVIDDVTTTGATFKEAERALREARANKVLSLAIAH